MEELTEEETKNIAEATKEWHSYMDYLQKKYNVILRFSFAFVPVRKKDVVTSEDSVVGES